MTRDEMLAKLKAIEPTACPTVMTYDMGLQFEIMDSTGADTNFGNIGDWPLWKLPRLTDEEIVKIIDKMESKTLKPDDFNGAMKAFAEQLLEYHKDIDLSDFLSEVVDFPAEENERDLFVYCDIKSWDPEAEFFGTREEITDDFFDRFQISTDWEEMDDDTLQSYCELIDEQGQGVPFYTPGEETEDAGSDE